MHKRHLGFITVLLATIVFLVIGGAWGYLFPQFGDKGDSQNVTLEQKEADMIFWNYYDNFYKVATPSGDVGNITETSLMQAVERFFTPESITFIKNNPQYKDAITFFGLSVYDEVREDIEAIKNYIPLTEDQKKYYGSFFRDAEGNPTLPSPYNEPSPFPQGHSVGFLPDGQVDFFPARITVVVSNDRIGWNVEGFGMDLIRSGMDWKFDILGAYCIENGYCVDPIDDFSQ